MTTTYKTYFNNLNFGLYEYDNINYDNSKINILNGFKLQYEKMLIKALSKIGLKYNKLTYYSPKYYNYENDSIDLTISIKDKKKLLKAILKYSDIINKKLSENKSYSGYIALTTNNIKDEIEDLKHKKGYEIDSIVLMTILNQLIDFKDFFINDFMVFEDEILN